MNAYILVQKAQREIVAVYTSKETAIDSVKRLNNVFGLPIYGIIEKPLFRI